MPSPSAITHPTEHCCMTPTLKTTRLDYAVEQYREAIAALEAAGEKLSVEHILEVLTARDAVQAAMADKTQPHPGYLIKTVYELDERLRQQAKYISRVVKLSEWRSILYPPQKDSWWLLDPITPKPWRDRYDWLWRGLSLTFLTASLSLLIVISTRFLSGETDTRGIFAVIIPGVLTLLTGGGALTKTGQECIEYILTSLKINKGWWDEIICLVSVLLFGLMLLFWNLLPSISNYYKEVANQAYCVALVGELKVENNKNCIPKITSAEALYTRAIKLDPENLNSHYMLGKIYAELQDNDKAITQYKIVAKSNIIQAYNDLASLYFQKRDYTQADNWLWKSVKPENANNQQYALNNEQYTLLEKLVRVYIDEKKYTEAIRWLSLGLKGTRMDNEKQYTMLSYFGWVRLRQERTADAKDLLLSAITLKNDEAPAHCLLAEVLEQMKDIQGAKMHWEQCISYASRDIPDEDYWIGLALEGLRRIKGEK